MINFPPWAITVHIIQLFALLMAILYWPRYKDKTTRYFLWFLIFVNCIEILGSILSYVIVNENGQLERLFKVNTNFIYNIYTLFSVTFFLYWFKQLMPHYKKIMYGFLALFFITILFMVFYEGFFDTIWLAPVIIGGIFIIISICLLFASYLKSDEPVNFMKSQPLWIATGLLVFYLGIVPLLYFQEFVILRFASSYGTMIALLNVILYGCIGFSFLCLRKK